MSRLLRIAAAQYPLSDLADLAAYEAKIGGWVAQAAGQGAEVLVFPEYGSMELASIAGKGRDIQGALDAVSALIPEVDRVHSALARRHGVLIVAGSAPQRRGSLTLNVARVFGPSGAAGSYDKIMPTPGERSLLGVTGGRTLKLFETPKAKIGLLICYDIEFPLLSRALAEAGAEIILAPSDTETEWGYWRVRVGGMARALENQCYVVHAPLIGAAPFCQPCASNAGAAGIYAPSDAGFPAGGIVALGEMNVPQWLYGDLDLDRVAEVRDSGYVQTFRHWSEQPGVAPAAPVEVVRVS
jgi:predicted amidohydrolase